MSNPSSELKKIYEARNQHEAGSKQFWLGLILNPEDGVDMLLRNVK
jgi:hypothetical protein